MAVVPANSHVVVAQGSDATLRVNDIRVDGVSVTDFTGWTGRAQIRPYKTAPELYYTFPPEDFGFDEPPDVLLQLPAAISSAFDWYYGYYDIELVDPDDKVQRVAQGTFQLDPETTR